MDVRAPYIIESYVLPSSEIDPKSICLTLSTVAARHASHLGILNGFDPERDCGWVILSMRMRILQTPKPEATITLETWVAAIEGAHLIREYRIRSTDANNPTVFVEAVQSFVLFDRETRKLVVPPKDKRELLKGGGRTFKFSLDLDRQDPAKEIPTTRAKRAITHAVTPDEVDHNGHLNHAEYLKWMDAPVKEFAIEFLREARLGDVLRVETWKEKGDTKVAFTDNRSSNLSALARFI